MEHRAVNDEQLKQLLETADEATPSPAIEAGLAARVRRRGRTRTRRRVIGAASVLAVALVGTVAWSGWYLPGQGRAIATSRPAGTQVKQVASDPLRDKLELAQLERDAEMHSKIASALLRAEPKVLEPRSADDIIVASRIVAELAENRERAAHTMVERGDRLMSEWHDPAQAASSYRRVIELFP